MRIAETEFGDHVEFKHSDLTTPLDFIGDSNFDVIVNQLTLDSIESWRSVFEEFHRVLSSEGVVVYSVNHPFHDYIMIEYEPKYNIDETNYFAVEQYSQNWGTDDEPDLVPFYRRSLQEIIQPPLKAGFVVDDLIEPIPDDDTDNLEDFREDPPRIPLYAHTEEVILARCSAIP